MENPEPKARGPLQMGLGMLLYLVMVISLGLGWYQDHQRLEDAQAKMPLEKQLLRDQQEAMEIAFNVETYGTFGYAPAFRLSGPLVPLARTPIHLDGQFPWNAEAYLAFLATLPSRELNNVVAWHRQVEVTVCRLEFAPNDVYQEVMPKVLSYFDSPEDDTRRGLVFAMGRQLIHSPDRVATYRTEVLAKIVACLDDSNASVIHEAILTLAELGLEARVAAPRLRALADEDQNPHALVALCLIDPNEENRQRVRAWIFERKPDWEFVAWKLELVMPHDEGVELLRQAYWEAKSSADQKVLAERINLLEVRRLTESLKQADRENKEEQR